MAAERPPTIDPVAAARWEGAAPVASPWLHEEVGRRMQERLSWIKLQPDAWADWAPLAGGLAAHDLVARRYQNSKCFVVETLEQRSLVATKLIAKPWWTAARLRAGATRIEEPPPGSVQMLWANMALHLCADPGALITRWHRALATSGFLMFSCLGPDTARELRDLYTALGWGPAGHAFTDMHDWGDMLLQAGFAEPVMDMERITLTYATPARLLAELREIGRNLHPARHPSLRGRRWRARLEDELRERLADPAQEGRLALSVEIIYGHAFKAAPRLPVAERSAIGLDAMREMLKVTPKVSAERDPPHDDRQR